MWIHITFGLVLRLKTYFVTDLGPGIWLQSPSVEIQIPLFVYSNQVKSDGIVMLTQQIALEFKANIIIITP
ncbi:hypothetical protein J6590_092083, partial [Homalodisca vitripennis]